MISKQQRFSLGVIVSVLLGVWMDVASGMMSIQLIPQYPVIQGSVTLSVTGITGRLASSIWYKGSILHSDNQILSYFPGTNPTVSTGRLYNSRMTSHPNGSLQISNLNISDEGNYTVKIQADTAKDLHVYLQIYEIVGKPTITTSTPQPKENESVQLTCNSTKAERIVWSRVPSGATLSTDNRTISFSINRSDSGNYWCEASNPVSQKKSDPITISVAYGPEKVKVEAHSLPNSLISLKCSADSVPPPTFQWRLNGTLVKVQQNPLQVDQKKMENEGTYTCVANNSVTLSTATDSVYVNASIEFQNNPETNKPDLGLIVGIVVAVILVLVLVASLLYLFIVHRRHKKNSNDKSSTIKITSSSRNGQSNSSSAETQPELQYASIVFSKNMPKRQQPPPDSLYANRTELAQPPETVYSDIKHK